MNIAKHNAKRRGGFRFKKPVIEPVPVPPSSKPAFPWWQRTHWDSVWNKVVTVITLILKLFPKTAVIGELLGKATTKTKSWVDIIVEFIQMLIIKLKSLRRK